MPRRSHRWPGRLLVAALATLSLPSVVAIDSDEALEDVLVPDYILPAADAGTGQRGRVTFRLNPPLPSGEALEPR